MSAAGRAAEAWRPPRTRLPAVRVRPPVPGWTWSTPVLLYAFLGAILASTGLLFLSVTVGVGDSGAGFQTVGTDSAPSTSRWSWPASASR